MKRQMIRRLRGGQKLSEQALDRLVDRIEHVHHAFDRPAFAVLERIPITRGIAGSVDQAEQAITAGVYSSIRTVIHTIEKGASWVLDEFEKRMD